VLLARYSNETDIVVGSPTANREQSETAGLIGFFVNTLVLRSDLSDNPNFNQLLNHSKTLLLDAYANQQAPFEQIVEKLQPQRSLGHSPLFQVMLILQSDQQDTLALPGLVVSEVEQHHYVSKYDLLLSISQGEQGLSLAWLYNADLFAAKTIAGMAAHFATLLDSLLKTPQQSVFTASMLSETQTHQQLVSWNDTQTSLVSEQLMPKTACIHQLFEAQAEQNPNAVAVMFEDQQLSYAQLNAQANQLAHHLVTTDEVGPDTLVGICLERSVAMVVSILGILKAGGAYVPLDPDYPATRLAYMLEDAQLKTVITESSLLARTPISAEQALCLEGQAYQDCLSTLPDSNLSVQTLGLKASHLAYVIYTSGSTGKPKGVMVEHQALINRIDWMERQYGSTPQDRILQKTPFSFDVSVWEFIWPLSVGAGLVLAKAGGHKEPQYLVKLIDSAQVSKLHFVPSMLSALLAQQDLSGCTSLQQVFCSGEALPLNLAKDFVNQCPKIELHNLYGPTEAAIDVSHFSCNDTLDERSSIPIGRPIQNIQLYVLNKQAGLVPLGATGELYIGGVGLARGYLNRAELTEAQFIANPFYQANKGFTSERLYKTGDLARWLPEGNLEYLGRIDHQVKLRGFRIELGEIENTLAEHPKIKDVVVMVRNTGSGDQQLVAYVVTDADEQDDVSELRVYLSDRLPEHMVPSAFILLAQLPLTANGKLDRKALPEPDLNTQQSVYVAPGSDLEKTVCEIWQDVLGIEQVGLNDNFFELGGHSLLAMKLVGQISQQLAVDIPIKVLFEGPVLAQFTTAILQLDGLDYRAISQVSRDAPLLTSYAQQRLWLLDQIDGSSAHYNIPESFHLSGELNLAALNLAFATIIERHESLRTCFIQNDDDQLIQIIQDRVEFELSVTDLSALGADERASALAQMVTKEAVGVFDLSRDIMMRGQVIKLATGEHTLLVTLHHIAADGWSMLILLNELSALYGAYSQGEDNPLVALAVQYADYADWQRNWLRGDVLTAQMDYWALQLADLPVVHNLPLDKVRPTVQGFAGATCYSRISGEVRDKLQRLCVANDATLFMGLHAAFSVLLARYSNETDIVVGSPTANREQSEIAGLIGFFVNTLVLRSDLSDNPNFNQLLDHSKTLLLDAYAHQQLPFEQIVEKLQPQRSLGHSPLFQVMLVLQSDQQDTLVLPGLAVSEVEQHHYVAKYDLLLSISQSEQGLSLGWGYNTDLFEARTIEAMAAHFTTLLGALLKTPQQSVFKAQMLSEADVHLQLVQYNDTHNRFTDALANNPSVHQLFEAQAEQNPNAVAVVFEGQQLSYAQLNAQASQLAVYLQTLGVQPDNLVGLCAERSIEMIVAVLAILKAGGGYLPLDPQYPDKRLAYMLEDAGVNLVLTQNALRAKVEGLAGSHCQLICLDSDYLAGQSDALANSELTTQVNASNLAYVIYTSGSTGQPKGVLIEHQSVINLVYAFAAIKPLNRHSRCSAWTAQGFDVSVYELFTPLLCGGTLYPVPVDVRMDSQAFFNWLDQHQINSAYLPAFFLNDYKNHISNNKPPIERLLVGVEPIAERLLHEISDILTDAEIINGYGPTEATVCATLFSINQHSVKTEQGRNTPIGKPLANSQTYVLDSHLNPVALGCVGELHIGGAG
ncbi:MAG: amino acid adenylation domain-containing protein, partial [Algicola sp.]|nr:amino acid adenylation domain-containing protein [Algicola sp.]